MIIRGNLQTLTLVFSCEYCETFKNTYFDERLQTAASNREAPVPETLLW